MWSLCGASDRASWESPVTYPRLPEKYSIFQILLHSVIMILMHCWGGALNQNISPPWMVSMAPKTPWLTSWKALEMVSASCPGHCRIRKYLCGKQLNYLGHDGAYLNWYFFWSVICLISVMSDIHRYDMAMAISWSCNVPAQCTPGRCCPL